MDTDVFETDLGWMAIIGEDGLLSRVLFGYESERSVWRAIDCAGVTRDRATAWQPDLAEQLRAFASGEPQAFDSIALDLRSHTPFGRDVVAACRQIGWGEMRTYGELAAECGAPGAARAVGNVMASNRFPLVVPCHRVVAAGGRLGGYSAPQGLAMKRRLLEMERGTATNVRAQRSRRQARVVA